MIGRSILFAISAAIACASVIVTLVGYSLHSGAAFWGPVVGGLAFVVAVFEWFRIRRTPIGADRPGIVPGDE